MATAVKQTLTQMLQPTPAQGPGAPLRAPGSDAAANTFSRTLERKMNEPERPREQAPQRPQESSQSQARQGVQAKQAETEKPAQSEPEREAQATDAGSRPEAGHDKAEKPTTGTEGEQRDTAAAGTASEAADASKVTTEAAMPAELIAAAPAALAVQAATDAKAPADATAAGINLMDGKQAAKGARPVELTATVLADDAAHADARGDLKGDVRADIGQGKTAASRMPDADIKPGAAVIREGATNFGEQLEQRLTAGMKPGEQLPTNTLNGATTSSGATHASAGVAGTPMPPAAVKLALPSHLGTPVSSQDWPDAVGNRVMWLAGKDESRAELILTPPSLGKLEISLTMSGDTTTAHFTAATPAAREALEQAMPRLREMLEQAGITLGESNVNTASQDQASEGGRHGQGRGGRHEGGPDMAMNTVGTPAGHWIARGEGMIDTFA